MEFKKYIPGKLYSVEEVKRIGFNPCVTCTMPNQCASKCMWAHGRYEPDNMYYWDGSKNQAGKPLYSNQTWHRVTGEEDAAKAAELYREHSV